MTEEAEPLTVDPTPPADADDTKIIRLAAQARARTQASQGACLRDTDGRTYAGSSVAVSHLSLSAVAVVVAMALSSGAAGAEALAVAGEAETDRDRQLLSELNCRIVWRATGTGEPGGSVRW